jgi:hypothetical protein
MSRSRQSNANRHEKKKRLLPNRSHLRKIRPPPKRRTNQSHNPRTHAHPKIIRRRLHPPQQSQQTLRRKTIQYLPHTKITNSNMKKNITLKHNSTKISITVDTCNLPKQLLGLMVFKKRALLLFNFNHPRHPKIHSLFCDPFLAVYTNNKNEIQEIINVKPWSLIIKPQKRFHKLIEIPLIPQYAKITRAITSTIIKTPSLHNIKYLLSQFFLL